MTLSYIHHHLKIRFALIPFELHNIWLGQLNGCVCTSKRREGRKDGREGQGRGPISKARGVRKRRVSPPNLKPNFARDCT